MKDTTKGLLIITGAVVYGYRLGVSKMRARYESKINDLELADDLAHIAYNMQKHAIDELSKENKRLNAELEKKEEEA